MANPYHHALSSVKKWGGEATDYLPVHQWFDQTKAGHGDFRHRAILHNSMGIFICEQVFGPTLTLSTGRVIPTRWVAEQHVVEDMGRIPSLSDWCNRIEPAPWMNRPRKLSRELEAEDAS